MKLAFLIIVSLFTIVNLWMCLKSLLYNKLIFKKYHSQKYEDNYTPKVSVFVPCKGADDNIKNHFEAIAKQNYPDFTVRFIVDNISDPVVDVINYITNKYNHTKLLVSGKAKKCGQKNYNLLRGIDYDNGNSDVYVFVDSDVQPHQNWLRELIRPLSLPSVPVTTGFRWLIPEDYSLSGAIHSMMSAYLCTLISQQFFRGVWGGSTAIKKEAFENLKVKELWANAVVDDMSLTKLLLKKRINRVYVPTCLTVSYNTLGRLKDDVTWYARQAAFLKAYLKPLWVTTVILHAVTTSLLILSPVFIFLSFFDSSYYIYAAVFTICTQINMCSYAAMKFIYKDKQRFIHWFLFAPLMQLLGFYSLIKPGFSNNIKWRNICYELARDGQVKSIHEINNAHVEII